jgi:LysM repeat protein
MSAMTVNTYSSRTSVNQGFYANPSAITASLKLNRRGRLARTLVVLSLAIVLASLVSAKAGAGTDITVSAPDSFITVTVAPGETVWTLANRIAAPGDVRALVSEISSVNNLSSVDITAGQKVRIPLR